MLSYSVVCSFNSSTLGITGACYMCRQDTLGNTAVFVGELKPPLGNGWLTWLSLCTVVSQVWNVSQATNGGDTYL